MTQSHAPDNLHHLIAHICHLHHGRARALFDEIGLHRGQPAALNALWENEGLTHTELADRMHVTPATVTKMIRRMEGTGFVTRCSDPEDQRVSRIYLTDKGRAVREEVLRVWQQLDSEAFDGFSPAEREQLRGFFGRIQVNLLQASGAESSW